VIKPAVYQTTTCVNTTSTNLFKTRRDKSKSRFSLRKAGLLPLGVTTVVQVTDNVHQLLESFFDCVTTGPSGALVGGNICMEDQCVGNGPKHTQQHVVAN